jgi:hypothetical protein
MKRASWSVLVWGLILLLSCCLLYPQVAVNSDAEMNFHYSSNNIRQIGLALHDYHDLFGQLPPRVVRGKEGDALYSWRVALLPFLEQDNLYKKFTLDEPWDGPHNNALLAMIPRVYTHMNDTNYLQYGTHYQVFVGPGTAFEQDGMTFDDFPDGLAETVLVVEANEPVLWTKPEDLEYSPDKPLPALGGFVSKPVKVAGWDMARRQGALAVFGDANFRFIPKTTDEQTLHALITRNGGEKVDVTKLK